jgi:hypothetical protein
MLLGAEFAPKEINGVKGGTHDAAVVPGQYIFGGFGGAGGGTGFKNNRLVPVTSKGAFEPP